VHSWAQSSVNIKSGKPRQAQKAGGPDTGVAAKQGGSCPPFCSYWSNVLVARPPSEPRGPPRWDEARSPPSAPIALNVDFKSAVFLSKKAISNKPKKFYCTQKDAGYLKSAPPARVNYSSASGSTPHPLSKGPQILGPFIQGQIVHFSLSPTPSAAH
jgi:hypothetical protein